MACSELFDLLGFTCLEKDRGVFKVFTPLTFYDGEPIGFYVFESNNSVRISDNANTLFHFRSVGFTVDDRRSWKWIENIVKSLDIDLKPSGEITGKAIAGSASHLIARYMSALIKVADAEKESMGIEDEVESFVQEVETYLRLWKPDENFSLSPSITGHSGRKHKFHFRIGDNLVDAARPHSARTGSILRKAADIQNTAEPLPIMIVMDDREDPERAKDEADILSTFVSVLPFTRLRDNLSGAPLTLN